MTYIKDLVEGTSITNTVYLCKKKSAAVTKNGKDYFNVELQDKTGTIIGKIWEPDDFCIEDFNSMDYIMISGDISSFNNALQISIRQCRIANENEYNEAEYSPTTEKDVDEMYSELLSYINSIKNTYLNALVKSFFVDSEKFIKKFKMSSAAKTVHHAYIGGLLEHTLSVTKMCDYLSSHYDIINRDLLLTAAICHDIGKVKELSTFPENDYTDEGNLLGHIIIGYELINEHARKIEGFPKSLLDELKHCILAHHGKLEYGSPKTPGLSEATILHFADDIDAKMQIFTELSRDEDNYDWQKNYFIGTIRNTKTK